MVQLDNTSTWQALQAINFSINVSYINPQGNIIKLNQHCIRNLVEIVTGGFSTQIIRDTIAAKSRKTNK